MQGSPTLTRFRAPGFITVDLAALEVRAFDLIDGALAAETMRL